MKRLKAILTGMLLPVVALATVTIPYVYTPNTTIKSSQENANNQALQNEINTHESKTTNVHGTNGAIVDINSDQTINGSKTFQGTPKMDLIKVRAVYPQTTYGHQIPNVADDIFILANAEQSLLMAQLSTHISFMVLRHIALHHVGGSCTPSH